MDTTELQERLDRMPAAMNAKGKARPEATMMIKGNEAATLFLQWKAGAGEKDARSDIVFNHVSGVDFAEILDNADRIIAALPSIEEAKMAEFTNHLAMTIELGRANGIDVEYVNPLLDAMKRLSENAITHRLDDDLAF